MSEMFIVMGYSEGARSQEMHHLAILTSLKYISEMRLMKNMWPRCSSPMIIKKLGCDCEA